MQKSVQEVLDDLVQPSNISVRSGEELLGKVRATIADDDKAKAEEDKEPLRRKPRLEVLARAEFDAHSAVVPWAVLHTLARATALSAKGAGRGLAEHWGALKYNQALAGGPERFLRLTDEGQRIAEQYKNLQSGELGVGFGLTVAEQVLRRRFPAHSVTIVAADTALRGGWALNSRDKGPNVRYRYRPHYFAEVWRPGERSLVVPIVCKGNHGNESSSIDQLVSASAHAEGVHLGEWNETPGLLLSTELALDGVVTVHVLQAVGRGGRLDRPRGERLPNLDTDPEPKNIFPGIQPPPDGDRVLPPVPGCQLTPEYYTWFQETLGRTDAAALMAFTGSGAGTAKYLTERQGRKRFTDFAHAASNSVQDVRRLLQGRTYVGTDHVFRLNGPRVEAFSGLDVTLFDLLRDRKAEKYRALVHAERDTRPRLLWDEEWNGPLSVRADGSVLALRVLPPGGEHDPTSVPGT